MITRIKQLSTINIRAQCPKLMFVVWNDVIFTHTFKRFNFNIFWWFIKLALDSRVVITGPRCILPPNLLILPASLAPGLVTESLGQMTYALMGSRAGRPVWISLWGSRAANSGLKWNNMTSSALHWRARPVSITFCCWRLIPGFAWEPYLSN